MNINPQFVYDAANDFRTGSEILKKRMGNPRFPLRSTTVLAALSVELYLKCLLYGSSSSKGKILKEHRLKILYDKLENNVQKQIIKNLKTNSEDAPDINAILIKFDDTFSEWRYIYEQQNSTIYIQLNELFSLMRALHETVKK
jgi:hypothetical protein